MFPALVALALVGAAAWVLPGGDHSPRPATREATSESPAGSEAVASHTQSPGPAAAPRWTARSAPSFDTEQRAAAGPEAGELRAMAMRHWEGRRNAFFKEEDSRLDFAELGQAGIDGLYQQLSSTEDLQALPEDVDFLQDKPAAAIERMAMLDLLGQMAGQDPAALDRLADLASASINRGLPDHVKRVVLIEHREALAKVAHLDWTQASSIFAELPGDGLRDLLRPALVEGLVNGGMTHEEAMQLAATV